MYATYVIVLSFPPEAASQVPRMPPETIEHTKFIGARRALVVTGLVVIVITLGALSLLFQASIRQITGPPKSEF